MSHDYDMQFTPRKHPVIIEQNPAPPALPPTPGLETKITLPPSGIAKAIFQEGPWSTRPIPAGVDEVLIRPGARFGTSNAFELPAIGEGVVNDKKLEVINLTRNTHEVFWNDPLSGVALNVELDGLGSNVKLRVIGGRWVVVGLWKATEK